MRRVFHLTRSVVGASSSITSVDMSMGFSNMLAQIITLPSNTSTTQDNRSYSMNHVGFVQVIISDEFIWFDLHSPEPRSFRRCVPCPHVYLWQQDGRNRRYCASDE